MNFTLCEIAWCFKCNVGFVVFDIDYHADRCWFTSTDDTWNSSHIYIPRIMHMTQILVWFGYWSILPISFRVTSLALGHWYSSSSLLTTWVQTNNYNMTVWILAGNYIVPRARKSYFKWRILTFTGRNWKCHVIIVIKTDLSGFVVTMHEGACEQCVKSLGLTPSGFDFLFRTRPRALWQQTPPEPVLIP